MNKTELVASVASKAGLSKADAEKAVNATIASIEEAVAGGDSVALIGFGTFKVSERAARTGVNPATGAKIKIKASKAPTFKAGKAFKEAVNKKKKK